ncbi:UDP-N-acetylmuramate dehydrogenase [Candidatus Saccharibacteria bacterium]|nr:UDP-N-acetylmuramate dehydrogenase [Candidatus Saccharibacteria bacterium]
MKIRENVPLSELTTMRLGGPARFVIDVENQDDVPAAFAFAKDRNLPFFILGGGANTIAKDAGFDGVIIRNAISGITTYPSSINASSVAGPVQMLIMGGTPWDTAVAFACERDLTGIEALSKIPGLSGAAPVQNIGAYGQDISQTFESAYVYDTKDQAFKTLEKSDFGFSYRKSILNTTEPNRYFVISITLVLHQGEMPRPFYNSIERYIAEHGITDFSPQSIRDIVSHIRADKLPDPKVKPSAGSFFKNIYLTEEAAAAAEAKGYPVYHGHDGLKINSGWLIEQCDLKGELLHGIRVNPKAALVLINESATSYQDLAAARAEIINKVQAKFGFTLEQEPVEL